MEGFLNDLETLGFRPASKRGDHWSLQATPYLIYSVHLESGKQVLFTWELAIGELMSDRGLQVGSNDPLNVFLFPQADARGPADTTFVVDEMNRTEQILRSLDLTGGAA